MPSTTASPPSRSAAARSSASARRPGAQGGGGLADRAGDAARGDHHPLALAVLRRQGRQPVAGARRRIAVAECRRGVVVLDVDDGSYASNLGFQRGDVIQEVNGERSARPAILSAPRSDAEPRLAHRHPARRASRFPRCSADDPARQSAAGPTCSPPPASTRTRRGRSPTSCGRRSSTRSSGRIICSGPTAR